MHQAKFDIEKMQIIVITGPGDEYKPSQKLMDLHNDLQKYKRDLDKYVLKTFKVSSQKDLEELFKKDEKLKEKFLKYVQDRYLTKLEKIKEEVMNYNNSLLK